MAKAHFTTKSGTVVTIDGTPEEIAKLMSQLEGAPAKPNHRPAKRRQASAIKDGPAGLLSGLIDEGFFKKPKELGAIKAALEEQGHYYPRTTLSPLVLRFVRKNAHSDDRDQSFQRIATSVTWVRDGAVGCCF